MIREIITDEEILSKPCDAATAADAAIAAVRQLSADVDIPTVCEAITEDELDQIADDALADACYPGNPRDADHETVVELFRKIMK